MDAQDDAPETGKDVEPHDDAELADELADELDLDAIIAELTAGSGASTPGAGASLTNADADDDDDDDEEAAEPWRADDAEEPPLVPRLWAVVAEALGERGWRYDEITENTTALARVTGEAAYYDVLLSVDERAEMLYCWVGMPVRVPEARRGATCELFNRVNYGVLGFGCFELDPDDGRPRWRQSIDVEGGLLGTTMVHNMVGAGLAFCDRYWPALMAVSVLGATVVDALALVPEVP